MNNLFFSHSQKLTENADNGEKMITKINFLCHKINFDKSVSKNLAGIFLMELATWFNRVGKQKSI
jgi:hypothetical protein